MPGKLKLFINLEKTAKEIYGKVTLLMYKNYKQLGNFH